MAASKPATSGRGAPKQAFAAREAHEALREVKKLVDEATVTTHQVELESFHIAVCQGETKDVRRALQAVIDGLKSQRFDAALSLALEKLEAAATS
jgi:hypothetical protein